MAFCIDETLAQIVSNITPEECKWIFSQLAKLSEVATAMGIVIDKFVNIPVKSQLDRQKLELEIVKVESKIKDSQPEEEAEDNFMDALNAAAVDVWEDGQDKE